MVACEQKQKKKQQQQQQQETGKIGREAKELSPQSLLVLAPLSVFFVSRATTPSFPGHSDSTFQGKGAEGGVSLEFRNFCRGTPSPKPFTTWSLDNNDDSC